MAVKPKDAATVILLRKSEHKEGGNFEVLMVLRHPDSIFVPDTYVFPGGVVDAGDYASGMESYCVSVDRGQATLLMENMAVPEQAIGAWVAGIRETFEEVGLLMAYREDGRLLRCETEREKEKYRIYRRSLFEGRLTLKELLEKEKLKLATDRLCYFSHWITPEYLPLRYDVRFFVAEAPEGQEALHDGIELTNHEWISPQEALEGYQKKCFRMILPTLMTMKELARFRDIEDVIVAVRQKKIDLSP